MLIVQMECGLPDNLIGGTLISNRNPKFYKYLESSVDFEGHTHVDAGCTRLFKVLGRRISAANHLFPFQGVQKQAITPVTRINDQRL